MNRKDKWKKEGRRKGRLSNKYRKKGTQILRQMNLKTAQWKLVKAEVSGKALDNWRRKKKSLREKEKLRRWVGKVAVVFNNQSITPYTKRATRVKLVCKISRQHSALMDTAAPNTICYRTWSDLNWYFKHHQSKIFSPESCPDLSSDNSVAKKPI